APRLRRRPSSAGRDGGCTTRLTTARPRLWVAAARVAVSRSARRRPLFHLDPRIDDRVRDVTDQIAQDEQRARDHHAGHDHRVVLLARGRVSELSYAGPGEDLFDHERA